MKKSFSDRIRQHRPEWDKEGFWSQLEPDLPRPTKRRLPLWWWLGGIALLLLAVWGIYPNQGTPRLQAMPIPLRSAAATAAKPSGAAVAGAASNKESMSAQKQPADITYKRLPFPTSAQPVTAELPAAAKDMATAALGLEPNNLEEVKGAYFDPVSRIAQPEFAPKAMTPNSDTTFGLHLSKPVQSSAASRWFQSLYAEAAYATRQREAPSDLLPFLEEREGQLREAVTLGYSVGYEHSSGWFAQAGLELQQRRELLHWEGVVDSSAIVRDIDQAFAYTNPNGQIVYQSGEVEVTELTRRSIVQQNYFHSLAMPLDIGYRYRTGRWSWQVQAGLRFNLWHRFSGKWVTPDNQVLNTTMVNEVVLNPDLGVGWSASSGAAYQAWPKSEVFAQLRFQRNTSSLVRRYNLQHEIWGLQLGLRSYF